MSGKLTELPKALVIALVITVIACNVFYGLSLAVNTVDVASLDPWSQGVVALLKTFFAGAQVAFVIVFIRNMAGFAENFVLAQAQGTAAVYEVKRYWGTAAYYLGGISIVFLALPAPYNSIGVGLVFLVDLVASKIAKSVTSAAAAK